ncbi:MAG TPA: leucine--tRNA ligase [Thermoplasmatales archaeon]|nr:leucine--tRNA ligase [Thermoplasmatales archaeon]
MKAYDYESVEQKWQSRWFKEKIYEAIKREGDKKFFIHFAYPGVSGYLHVGHMRGFTYADIIARYKRMRGYSVLFPAGFHASGIPSVGFAKKVERGDPNTIRMLRENGCSDETIEKLKNPIEIVNFFSKIYVEEYWKRFGFLIDYSRLMSTISEGYKRFIQWQFLKLNERGLLIKKTHFAPFCPNCGPVAVDKSETDISKGGEAQILEFVVIKFRMEDGTILPAATLRPETIFGVTNMWLNPDVEYEKIKVGEEIWICSPEAVNKLSYQFDNLERTGERIKGSELIGRFCTVPLVNRDVPILSGPFVDPNVATGVVMSVPAHAPYDWIALVESKADINPIQIIEVEGYGTNPAREVCEELGIKSQNERDKLDKATEVIYKREFHTGVLNDLCGKYAGLRISEIKDEVKNDMIEEGIATVMREFSEEVICRCGEKVVIKKIPDQWFIKYSDPDLTETAKNHVSTMNIYPEEYKRELPGILDWFSDRACIRKGSWLGTEFPFKKGWIIEPISDSTLYPIYYIVSKYVNEGLIRPEEMDETFFDYVFLGKGKAKSKIWEDIRDDVLYWYPVDINLGGKEHKTVHFPVFIMNHVAILDKELWPRGIFVHWWITQKGKEKISKSKGGAEPIPSAAKTYGVDAMRLYYAHIGSPFVDVEWDPEVVINYKNRIFTIWNTVNELIELEDKEDEQLDRWLRSTFARRIKRITEFMDRYDLRDAANEIFFEIPNDIRWYRRRGGSNKSLLRNIVERWTKLMTPFTPHLAEEIWETIGNEGFVSDGTYPEYNSQELDVKAEIGEDLLKDVVGDINEILKVTGIRPTKIFLYVARGWKREVYMRLSRGEEIGTVIRDLMKDENLRKMGKEVSKFVKDAVVDIKKLPEQERGRYQIEIDEKKILESGKKFLETEFGAKIVIEDADSPSYDPSNKSRFARPLKPAIYVE